MKCGKITIDLNVKNSDVSVYIELVDNTVWLTKSEIAYLFRVFTPSITANLKTLFANNDLIETEVTRHERFADKNGLMYSTQYFNLDVIIALSFRMKGGFCRIFREWLTKQITQTVINSKKTPIIIQLGNSTFIQN